MTTPTARPPVEMAWFSALCDDDYEFLGRARSAAAPARSSTAATSCSPPTATASTTCCCRPGYQLGIDNTAFAAAMAPMTTLRMLLAIRCGELVVPQLARQLATIDQIMGGRLTVNIISSDVPGETLDSGPRYRRSTEIMFALRELLDGHAVKFHGDFVDLEIDPPRVTTVSGRSPLFYFGGLSPDARECAAAGADVFLMWPDTTAKVLDVKADMDARAAAKGRHAALRLALARHRARDRGRGPRRGPAPAVEARRRRPARRSASGRSTRRRPASPARRRCATRPTTRATSSVTCGPASAGPARAPARRSSAIPTRCWPRSTSWPTPASRRSSCPATRTPPSATCSPATCCRTSTTAGCEFTPDPVNAG